MIPGQEVQICPAPLMRLYTKSGEQLVRYFWHYWLEEGAINPQAFEGNMDNGAEPALVSSVSSVQLPWCMALDKAIGLPHTDADCLQCFINMHVLIVLLHHSREVFHAVQHVVVFVNSSTSTLTREGLWAEGCVDLSGVKCWSCAAVKQTSQSICELRVEQLDNFVVSVIAVCVWDTLTEKKVPQAVSCEQLRAFMRIHHVPQTLRHLLSCHRPMRVHMYGLRQRQPSTQKEGRPVDGVEF